jgi:hypothetical protein
MNAEMSGGGHKGVRELRYSKNERHVTQGLRAVAVAGPENKLCSDKKEQHVT